MTKEEINQLYNSLSTKATSQGSELIETHISWVILSDEFAYKIKKPLNLHFLDFSSLAARKQSCEVEFELNRRLAKEMYLGVLPVRKNGKSWQIGEGQGEIVDYAVWMKRMDLETEMPKLLANNKVKPSHIRQLARQVAHFHQEAKVVKPGWDKEELKKEFNDLISTIDIVIEELGEKYGDLLNEALIISDVFLDKYWPRIQERIEAGYIRNVHGDLHAGNIFLTEKPIIFDCIEFNEEFRHIDLLNEVAFFCMDMEAHHRNDLSKLFLEAYLNEMGNSVQVFDGDLFDYFKAYRANVRAKVKSLAAMQATGDQKYKLMEEVKNYLLLMKSYLIHLV